MKKTFTLAVIGGSIGVGFVIARSGQGGDAAPDADPGPSPTTVVGSAAAAGAVLGFLLDRRARKRRGRVTPMSALKAGDFALAARVARPLVESAVEAARPKVEHAIEVARPHLEHAAEATMEAAKDAAQYARPKVEQALESALDAARPKMDDAVKLTKAKARDAGRRLEKNGYMPAALISA